MVHSLVKNKGARLLCRVGRATRVAFATALDCPALDNQAQRAPFHTHHTPFLDPQVKRFAISFKSRFHGKSYRHIVLGVYHNGKFGALGLSRKSTLMDKPLAFASLGELIQVRLDLRM